MVLGLRGGGRVSANCLSRSRAESFTYAASPSAGRQDGDEEQNEDRAAVLDKGVEDAVVQSPGGVFFNDVYLIRFRLNHRVILGSTAAGEE